MSVLWRRRPSVLSNTNSNPGRDRKQKPRNPTYIPRETISDTETETRGPGARPTADKLEDLAFWGRTGDSDGHAYGGWTHVQKTRKENEAKMMAETTTNTMKTTNTNTMVATTMTNGVPPAQIPIPLSLVFDTFPGSSGPTQSRSRVDDPCDAALIPMTPVLQSDTVVQTVQLGPGEVKEQGSKVGRRG